MKRFILMAVCLAGLTACSGRTALPPPVPENEAARRLGGARGAVPNARPYPLC